MTSTNFVDLQKLPVKDGRVRVSPRLALSFSNVKLADAWWNTLASHLLWGKKSIDGAAKEHVATFTVGNQDSADEHLGLLESLDILAWQFDEPDDDAHFTVMGDPNYSGELLDDINQPTLGLAVLKMLCLGMLLEDNILSFTKAEESQAVYHMGPIHWVPREAVSVENAEHSLMTGFIDPDTLDVDLYIPSLDTHIRTDNRGNGRRIRAGVFGWAYNPKTLDEAILRVNLCIAFENVESIENHTFTGNIFIK